MNLLKRAYYHSFGVTILIALAVVVAGVMLGLGITNSIYRVAAADQIIAGKANLSQQDTGLQGAQPTVSGTANDNDPNFDYFTVAYGVNKTKSFKTLEEAMYFINSTRNAETLTMNGNYTATTAAEFKNMNDPVMFDGGGYTLTRGNDVKGDLITFNRGSNTFRVSNLTLNGNGVSATGSLLKRASGSAGITHLDNVKAEAHTASSAGVCAVDCASSSALYLKNGTTIVNNTAAGVSANLKVPKSADVFHIVNSFTGTVGVTTENSSLGAYFAYDDASGYDCKGRLLNDKAKEAFAYVNGHHIDWYVSDHGIVYTAETNGALILVKVDENYKGTPTIVKSFKYGDVMLSPQNLSPTATWYNGTNVAYSDELIKAICGTDKIELDAIVTDLSDEDADMLDASYKTGTSNDSSDYQMWKKATAVDGNKLEIELAYFQKMHENVPLDFIFLVDETQTMSNNLATEATNGYKIQRRNLSRSLLKITADSILNQDGYDNRVGIVFAGDYPEKGDDNYRTSGEFYSSNAEGQVSGQIFNYYNNTACVNTNAARKAAVGMAKASKEDGRTPIIVVLGDFIGCAYSDDEPKLRDSATVFSMMVEEYTDSDHRRNANKWATGNKENTKRTFDAKGIDEYVGAFKEIFRQSTGMYIPEELTITDELSTGIANRKIVSPEIMPSANDNGTLSADANGKITWKFLDDSGKSLKAGKLYRRTIVVDLDKSLNGTSDPRVYSGSMPTNGACKATLGNNKLNEISESPIYGNDVTLQLKEANTNGESLAGGTFELYKGDLSDAQIESATPVWRGTTSSDGTVTIPYKSVAFEKGSTYTLKQVEAPSGYGLPGYTWLITVGDSYQYAYVLHATSMFAFPGTSKVPSLNIEPHGGKLEIYNQNYTILNIVNNTQYSYSLWGLTPGVDLMNNPGAWIIEEDGTWVKLEGGDAGNQFVPAKTTMRIAVLTGANKPYNLNAGFTVDKDGVQISASFINENGEAATISLPHDGVYNTKDLVKGVLAGKGEEITVKFNLPYANLTVSNEVVGDYGDKTHAFEIAIKADELKGGKGVQVEGPNGTKTVDFDAKGTALIELTHGQSATIKDLPCGAQIDVVETPVEGYDVTYTLDKAAAASSCSFQLSGDSTVKVTNTFSKPPLPTGVMLSDSPWMLLLGIATAGFIAILVLRFRRKSEE